MNKKQINWLQDEIETWASEGVINSDAAQRLKSRYARIAQDQRPVALIILGSLGALLIGLGVISLLAANWGDIPRNIRAVISFLPLLISYCVALYGGMKMKQSLAVTEPLGIFWGLSIGAGIALIAQTYHLPGEMDSFILTWMILLVPVVWLTRSLGCVVGYYIGLLFWAGYVQTNHGVGIWYWPLSALVFPLVVDIKRRSPTGMRGVCMFWSLLISSIIGLGITLEKSLPGLWIIIYTSFFTLMLVWGALTDDEASDAWTKPLSLCGGGGLAVVLYLLCYEWPWRSVGPEYYRYGYGYHLWASIIYDFTLTAVLLAASLASLLVWHKRVAKGPARTPLTKLTHTLWYAAPLVVTIIYGIASYASTTGHTEEICTLLACVYVAGLSLLTIANGIGSRALWMINCGMLLFLALVIGKFFSEDYSFTIKGIVFIVSGIIFFIVNTIFARRLKSEIG